ncbi:MAG: sulfatase-like hydrolase/transferase [Acidobacteriota bacterium]|nr:sulfatase-like hydrolase/transferase [Acidobacteriota bacterium]
MKDDLLDRVRDRGYAATLVIASVVLTPVIFTSFTIYSTNVMEFGMSILEMLKPLILFCLVAWTAGVILLMIAPKTVYVYLLSFFVALSLLFWIQGRLMVWDYSVLDGRPIVSSEYTIQAAVDSFVWVLVIALAIFFAKRIHLHARQFAVILILMQTATFGMDIWGLEEPPSFHRYRLDESHKYLFSKEKNVVLIILDAFQADIMMEILRDHPGYRTDFDGFTYYPNSLSAYSKTYAAIPAMLTGQWYENNKAIQDFLADAFKSRSVTNELIDLGWRVDLFPDVERSLYFSKRVASNMIPLKGRANTAREAGRLIDIALFRSSPHVLKKFWLNDYRWRFNRWFAEMDPDTDSNNQGFEIMDHPHPAIRFIKEAEAFSSAELSNPSFKLYHFMIPHEPFMLNEYLEMERLPSGRNGFFRHSKAGLEIVKRFLEVFRRSGIYDQTMFLVLSDHGGGEYLIDIDQTLLSEALQAKESSESRIPPRHMQSGLPLVLIKPFGASGELTISHAPVSLGDIASTIAESVALKRDYGGRNILNIGEKEDRTRRYLYFTFKEWNTQYLPDMTEYFIRGHSWIPSSWAASGNVFRPPSRRKAQRDEDPDSIFYDLGREIHFIQGFQETDWLSEGWSQPEFWGTWSNADFAIIRVPLTGRTLGALDVRFLFRPFLADGRLIEQRVGIKVNDHDLGEWRANQRNWHSVFIPSDIASASELLEIRLNLPDAAAPADFNLNNDERKLGIGITTMVIVDPPLYHLGQKIPFFDKSNFLNWLVDGWYEPQSNAVWSKGHQAVLRVPFAEKVHGPLEARFSFTPFLAEGVLDSQIVLLSVNGTLLEEWVVVKEGRYRALIPSDLVDGVEILEFVFQLPRATSLADHMESIDARVFGIELCEMEIVQPAK